jgi:hypothetical protein
VVWSVSQTYVLDALVLRPPRTTPVACCVRRGQRALHHLRHPVDSNASHRTNGEAAVKYRDLTPGDRVTLAGQAAIHICTHTPHPVYPTLSLVIWWVEATEEFSLDALDINYNLLVGTDVNSMHAKQNLRKALIPGTLK